MGERGKRLVADKYIWRQAAQRSIQVYEWLLGSAPRPEFVILD
jgi:poly(glycerol-phosphate) alpha-glucosyltransferase